MSDWLELSVGCGELKMSRERCLRLIWGGELIGRKVGSRWMVNAASLEQYRSRQQFTGPDVLPAELVDMYEPIERCHQFGVARAAELLAIEGSAREAEQAGNPVRAEQLRELVSLLHTAIYSFDAEGRAWRLTVGGMTQLHPVSAGE
jgi:hypothetical protein